MENYFLRDIASPTFSHSLDPKLPFDGHQLGPKADLLQLGSTILENGHRPVFASTGGL